MKVDVSTVAKQRADMEPLLRVRESIAEIDSIGGTGEGPGVGCWIFHAISRP